MKNEEYGVRMNRTDVMNVGIDVIFDLCDADDGMVHDVTRIFSG